LFENGRIAPVLAPTKPVILARATWRACLLLPLLFATGALAQELPPIANGVVGGEFEHLVKRGDSLALIGARYGVGPAVLAATNKLEYSAILRPGQRLGIDNRHVVPNALADGILINVPQRMLFFFRSGELVGHYPLGVGRPTWPTPTGSFQVTELRENPVWRVPKSIQREMAMEGDPVRTVVPPGPDNPLGKYWIGLSIWGYGVHGTNALASIYTFQTHGCMRLHPDDVSELFRKVTIGTPGKIIYEPVLMARLGDGRIFLEVNRDVYRKGGDPMRLVRRLADSNSLGNMVDWNEAEAVARRKQGIARDITAGHGRKPEVVR
jgi:L,D-transpeptidase ErfK/SrfK